MKLRRILTDKEQQFLIKNDAYEAFMKNVVPTRLLTDERTAFIDRYIYWVDTPQGYSYWSALYEAWENIRETI